MPLEDSAQVESAYIVAREEQPENVQNGSVSVDGSKPRKSILVNAQELNV